MTFTKPCPVTRKCMVVILFRQRLFIYKIFKQVDEKYPHTRRIPIIALTANSFDEDVQLSMQAGMNAHLSKPVEAERLIRVLGELVYEAEEKITLR